MSENKKLIDLELLNYYDDNIKSYIKAQIKNKSSNVIFLDKADFPETGDENVLYIAEDGVYRWNGTEYVPLVSDGGSSATLDWGRF